MPGRDEGGRLACFFASAMSQSAFGAARSHVNLMHAANLLERKIALTNSLHPIREHVSAALEAAYRGTDYRVLTESPFSLKVGESSLTADKLMQETGVRSAAFLTAWNPYSRTLKTQENERLNAELEKLLRSQGYIVCPGFGAWADDPDKGERSFFAVGISRLNATEMAHRFEQNAFVFIESGGAAELVFVDFD